MGSDLWDDYAQFDSASFWTRVNAKDDQEMRPLIANALCTLMDLGSAIYHSSKRSIEIYGLRECTAYSNFERCEQLDWRFVGYAMMASQGSTDGAQRVRLSPCDYYFRSEHKSTIKFNKVLREFIFAETVGMVELYNMPMTKKETDEMFSNCKFLKLVKLLNQETNKKSVHRSNTGTKRHLRSNSRK